MFTNDIVRKAFLYALKQHDRQIYADHDPYIIHLYDVSMTLVEFGIKDPKLLAAALLHDIIEDTNCNYHDISITFSEEIADIIYALTDELGKNRKERKQKTFPKLDGFPQAQAIKLADWISNVRQCHRNSHKMYRMYKKEYAGFSKLKEQISIDAHIEESLQKMWNTLDELLSKDESSFSQGKDKHHREYDLDDHPPYFYSV
jgi:(p)ppGpp synthase/HD superfamily hydrolase